MRRIPPSYALASLLVLALVVWLALGDFQRFQSTPAENHDTHGESLTRVEVSTQPSTLYIPQVVVQGQLAAAREAVLRANVAGLVAETPASQGEHVQPGETLLILESEALPERLQQARDELALAQAEYAGAQNLRRRELISQPELLRLQSALSASAAQVAQLEKQLRDTRPSAPFEGVLDRVQVEMGDLLQPGEEWARLVDDRHLKGEAWVSQQQVGALSEGLPVAARLLNGGELTGEVSYISRRADEATRTFYVEVILDNPERQRLAGGSAELTITLPPRAMHTLSPALFNLDERGQLAIRHLDAENRVVQSAVELVSADTQRAYVSGLPDPVTLITLGAGLVSPGEEVTPVPAQEGGNALTH